MAEKNGQYSTKTNAAKSMKPPPPAKLSGNFTNVVRPERPNMASGEMPESILKNSMSKMFIDDFWSTFEKNAEKMTSNPFVPKESFLSGSPSQSNKTMVTDLYEKSRVDIEKTRENIYNTTTKTISMQERLKETQQANPPMQTPHTTGRSSGRGGGGGGGNVTINNMATIDQVTIAAVMLPLWRQGFVG
jgi:hypothetical protein